LIPLNYINVKLFLEKYLSFLKKFEFTFDFLIGSVGAATDRGQFYRLLRPSAVASYYDVDRQKVGEG
jgi:hypothetical protein